MARRFVVGFASESAWCYHHQGGCEGARDGSSRNPQRRCRYIDGRTIVGGRADPEAEGEPFDMRLVSLDRTGSVAAAKVAVRYRGRQYTDYLTLQKAAVDWSIVGKLFFSLD